MLTITRCALPSGAHRIEQFQNWCSPPSSSEPRRWRVSETVLSTVSTATFVLPRPCRPASSHWLSDRAGASKISPALNTALGLMQLDPPIKKGDKLCRKKPEYSAAKKP